MIRIKPGVDLSGIRPEMNLVLLLAEEIYERVANKDVVVTAVRDGKHKAGSKHYVGLAVDLRTSAAGIDVTAANAIAAMLRDALGAQYDVVVEGDHIHVEFDPKEAVL